MNIDNLWDWVMARPFEIGDLIREVNRDAFLEAYDRRETNDYWKSLHLPVLKRCHSALDGNYVRDFKDVKNKNIWDVTKSLREVLDICSKPLIERQPTEPQKPDVVTLGRGFETYLFDGHTKLTPGDRVKIIVLEPQGHFVWDLKEIQFKDYEVEFVGERFGNNYTTDISAKLDKAEVEKLWGTEDHYGNPINSTNYGQVLYKMERIPGSRKQPVAGAGLNYRH